LSLRFLSRVTLNHPVSVPSPLLCDVGHIGVGGEEASRAPTAETLARHLRVVIPSEDERTSDAASEIGQGERTLRPLQLEEGV
jgi:hypothetical protein